MNLLLYVVWPSFEEAQEASYVLVQEKLVACVNLFQTQKSIYEWRGKLCESEGEVVMIAKTTKKKLQDAQDKITSLHPYECPAILALSILEGYGPFLEWISTQTHS